MKWTKTGRIENPGKYTRNWKGQRITESTTFYESDEGGFRIESRKRLVPHANGTGHWMNTTYWLIGPDGTEKECHSLRDAKAAAEGRR